MKQLWELSLISCWKNLAHDKSGAKYRTLQSKSLSVSFGLGGGWGISRVDWEGQKAILVKGFW